MSQVALKKALEKEHAASLKQLVETIALSKNHIAKLDAEYFALDQRKVK